MMNSFVLIDKASGRRSTSVVNQTRRLLGRKVKVGHTGTLDSTATGLLILLTGSLTRASRYVMALPKRYRVTLKLGVVTDTCDYSGAILESCPWQHLSDRDIDRVLAGFLGVRLQVPPKVSAIRINGQRAHALTRRGEDPELVARPVTFSRISRLSSLDAEGSFSLSVDCHQGTYIRSLARDLGESLGCGAHVLSLRRESVGPFLAEDALDSEVLFQEDREGALEMLQNSLCPSREILAPFLVYRLDDDDENRLRNGLAVPLKARDHFGVIGASECTAVEGRTVLSFGQLKQAGSGLSFLPRTNIFDQ